MKTYDPEKVEALLGAAERSRARLICLDLDRYADDLDAPIAAVRASAREAGEVSEEEIDKLLDESRYPVIDRLDGSVSFAWTVVRSLIRAALARFAAPRGEVARCRWAEDTDGTWETACGKAFIVVEGKPDENDMAFCCYCGGRIEQADYLDAPPRGEETKVDHPCSFPNCGTPEARLCWSKDGPNASAIALLPRGEEGA